MLSALGSQLNFLVDHVQRGPQSSDSPSSASPPATQDAEPQPSSPPPGLGLNPHVHLSSPEKFSGDSGDCRSFLAQCELHFEFQAASFSTDRAKVAYMISHMSGRAEAWATAEWSRRSAICESLPLFIRTLTQVFQTVSPGREAARSLAALRQGRRTVLDYAVEFRTLASDSGWNQAALCDAFFNGLSETLKDYLTPLDLPSELEALIALASKMDKRLRERQRSRLSSHSFPHFPQVPSRPQMNFESSRTPPGSTEAPIVPPAEPMQVGRTRLSLEERQRRMDEGCCIYCAQMGHFLANCPIRRGGASRSRESLVSSALTSTKTMRLFPTATLQAASVSLLQPVLIDSGADANFMDYELAKRLRISPVSLDEPLEASALDGRHLFQVIHHTPEISLSFGNVHSEKLSFHLVNAPHHPLLLGLPWLKTHNPHIDWSSGQILSWGDACQHYCLSEKQALPVPVTVTEETGSLPVDLAGVPSCYADLQEVFSKTKAASLPPHRPYDCAIDLLPGTM
uniref:DUF4939 domain-containing protein n=1 Tax=Lates calcarifer TaxID=8187 RepID=A0A4W6DG68_LATCA